MKVGIIGAGLIGTKRARSLPKGVRVGMVCDLNLDRAKELAGECNAGFTTDWMNVVTDSAIKAIFIATTNNMLTPIAKAAIENGKHVLIEKPGARSVAELDELIAAHKNNKVVVMFGYNHRYHPSVIKIKEIIESKKYGRVMFIRARYGHGARLGYEKEWRFDPNISGGGELLDQGPHLIDLVNYLVGPMNVASGVTANLYWKAKLEDSAFFILKNDKNQIAQLSVTCVEWKNIFVFEVMLERAKLQISGLGRSYGPEVLITYEMKPEMGPPIVIESDLSEVDDLSWSRENNVFFERIRANNYDDTALLDARYCLLTIEKIYEMNR